MVPSRLKPKLCQGVEAVAQATRAQPASQTVQCLCELAAEAFARLGHVRLSS